MKLINVNITLHCYFLVFVMFTNFKDIIQFVNSSPCATLENSRDHSAFDTESACPLPNVSPFPSPW